MKSYINKVGVFFAVFAVAAAIVVSGSAGNAFAKKVTINVPGSPAVDAVLGHCVNPADDNAPEDHLISAGQTEEDSKQECLDEVDTVDPQFSGEKHFHWIDGTPAKPAVEPSSYDEYTTSDIAIGASEADYKNAPSFAANGQAVKYGEWFKLYLDSSKFSAGQKVFFYIYSEPHFLDTYTVQQDANGLFVEIFLAESYKGAAHTLVAFNAESDALIGAIGISAEGNTEPTGVVSDFFGSNAVLPFAILLSLGVVGVVAYRRFATTK